MEFEKSLERLKQIVEKMQDENVSLDDSISLFDEGVKTSKTCLDKLKDSKGKITIIKKEMDELLEQDFNLDTKDSLV